MKNKKERQRLCLWQWAVAWILCMAWMSAAEPVHAIEQQIPPGPSIGNATRLSYDKEYFVTKAYDEEYFQFSTPAGHGYVRIVLSNISAGDGLRGNVITASGREVGGVRYSSGTWILDLEEGQTYYIHVWGGEKEKNYGLFLKRYADAEGVSKETAVEMDLNTDYVWSKEVDSDEDYGVFTADRTDTYRMTFSTIEGGDLYASLHVYNSDRQVGDAINAWGYSESRYGDYQLEAGVRYYVRIRGSNGNENFPIKYGIIVSNQKVTSIKLNKTSLIMKRWDDFQLEAAVGPSNAANKALEWSSSKPDIVSVSASGYLDAGIKPGRAVITCSAVDGGGARSICTVVVKPEKMYGLAVAKSDPSSIKLQWNKVEGVSGYTVYMYVAKDKKWKAIKTQKAAAYTVTKLKAATSYRFKVASYVQNGSVKVYGENSDVLTTATPPGRASISVQMGKVQGSYYYRYRTVTFSSKKVEGASGYQFLYSSSKGGSYYEMNSGKRSYKYTARTGQTFFFKARAYKKVGYNYYYGAFSPVKKVRI